MQMNVRNTLNATSCIGIKTVPSQKDPVALRSALPSVFYSLLNAPKPKTSEILSLSSYLSSWSRRLKIFKKKFASYRTFYHFYYVRKLRKRKSFDTFFI